MLVWPNVRSTLLFASVSSLLVGFNVSSTLLYANVSPKYAKAG